ncbi:short chain dehydrogenase [Pseudovirgaria hyperparasitica]|uniref:Short chain dehydrogenase n=1 Tax=Pseudovirgaria hyperparasitica TaxID=470096 RepID=A0A6A6W0U8_9PEZI|nr:short chain dehydrogenase [Pseudovirgaria hyperparasitica]KAF2756522.1 short chain dehydrogenase [Pseudovirgaria hyperparasitica]
MSRILITGSADGLGALAARDLQTRGHKVYLHARSAQRAKDAMASCPGAQQCLIADLSSLSDVKTLASDLKSLGPWDAIVHSAGVMHGQSGKTTAESWGTIFATNTVAPYVITSIVGGACRRYVFLSSSMESSGDPMLRGIESCSYSDSKLHNIMLASYFARVLKGAGVEESNALDPGWVPTAMGGRGAPGSLDGAVETYRRLAEGAGSTGGFWRPYAKKGSPVHGKEAFDEGVQGRLVGELARLTGVELAG